MEVTALCPQLLLNLLLLVTHSQDGGVSGADVRIVPSRLQFFEYQSVSFTCLGLAVSKWWVKNIKVNISACQKSTSLVNCTNRDAVVSDSGEYWCEGPRGERSNAVNITVSGGSVILESPVLPVMEGEAVTLRCRSKESISNPTAGFFKDGLLIGNSSTGTMTIKSVSMVHEGLYMCNISGVGESPHSPLTVRVSGADVRIVPSRLQLFEYKSVSFSCQGVDVSPEWRVKKIKVNISTCQKSTSLVNCTIRNAVVSDSGEYWCEGPRGERSNAVNITVSGGSVILESPVLPVKEGEAVTLRCRSKESISNLTAGFFRDGLFIRNSSTGTMTIESVSMVHEGLYMCNISGVGKSPQSPLTVRVSGADVRIVPSRLQLFEYQSVSFSCQGVDVSPEWRVKNIKQEISTCEKSTSLVNCTIRNAVVSDSGEYWCEGPRGERSNAVNITVSETFPSSDHSVSIYLFRTVFIVLSLVLQLLVVGLLHCGKLGPFSQKPSLT